LERRAVEETDATICTGERDANVYRDRYDPGGPIIVAPNGAYEDDLREHYPNSQNARRIRHKYDISQDATVSLFMGSNYRPNVEAAEVVVEIARDFKGRNDGFHFLVLGDVGNVLDDRDLPPNVTTTGYVEEDFEAHFDAADIALNPMLSGGGTNIKQIEYFARSLPVISTPFGVRGIEVRDGDHIVVAEVEAMPDAIKKLARSANLREKIGENGRLLAAERYTWEASSRTVRTQFRDLFGPF
jgi:glycosyltransferase involved in cell wall biosynthesis